MVKLTFLFASQFFMVCLRVQCAICTLVINDPAPHMHCSIVAVAIQFELPDLTPALV